MLLPVTIMLAIALAMSIAFIATRDTEPHRDPCQGPHDAYYGYLAEWRAAKDTDHQTALKKSNLILQVFTTWPDCFKAADVAQAKEWLRQEPP